MKTVFFFLLLSSSLADFVISQVAKEEDFQFWNDVQVTIPAAKRFDFILKGTFRFGENVTRPIDRRIAVVFN